MPFSEEMVLDIVHYLTLFGEVCVTVKSFLDLAFGLSNVFYLSFFSFYAVYHIQAVSSDVCLCFNAQFGVSMKYLTPSDDLALEHRPIRGLLLEHTF